MLSEMGISEIITIASYVVSVGVIYGGLNQKIKSISEKIDKLESHDAKIHELDKKITTVEQECKINTSRLDKVEQCIYSVGNKKI